MNRRILLPALLLFGASPAFADVLHLKNGRTMEGTVVSKQKTTVTLKVQGGTLKIPRATIKRIEERLTPQDEYTHRAAATNMGDPKAVEGLAHWASQRGLGAQAKQLRKMAQGLELQRRVDRLRTSRSGGTAQSWLALSAWAKAQRHSTEVQRYLVGKALEKDPKHEGALLTLQRLQRDEDRKRRRTKRRTKRQNKPAKPCPKKDAKEPKRLAELERKLEKQKSETDVLRDRVLQLEREKQERLREERQRRVRNQRRRSYRSRYRGRYLPKRPASPYYVKTR